MSATVIIIDYKSMEVIRLGLKELAILKFGQAKLLPKDNRIISNDKLVNDIIISLNGIPYAGGRELVYMVKILLANMCYKYIIGEISKSELSIFYEKYHSHIFIFYNIQYQFNRQLSKTI